jgi:hypothetical protein
MPKQMSHSIVAVIEKVKKAGVEGGVIHTAMHSCAV